MDEMTLAWLLGLLNLKYLQKTDKNFKIAAINCYQNSEPLRQQQPP